MSTPTVTIYAGTPEYPKVSSGLLADSSCTLSAPPNTITFHATNKEVLRITHDGRLVTGEGLSAEEATQQAAKLLISSFEEQIQKMVEKRIAAEREKVRVLRDALENLRDEQNGAPLCTRETEWKEAMDEADAALAATKEEIK